MSISYKTQYFFRSTRSKSWRHFVVNFSLLEVRCEKLSLVPIFSEFLFSVLLLSLIPASLWVLILPECRIEKPIHARGYSFEIVSIFHDIDNHDLFTQITRSQHAIVVNPNLFLSNSKWEKFSWASVSFNYYLPLPHKWVAFEISILLDSENGTPALPPCVRM